MRKNTKKIYIKKKQNRRRTHKNKKKTTLKRHIKKNKKSVRARDNDNKYKKGSLSWIYERPFKGGDLISVFPPKFFHDSEMIMKHGEEKYFAPFYKTSECVTDMCNPQEMTQACLNSLGIAMMEHQDYEDYQNVLKLYAKMGPEERMEVVDANLISLRTYLADLFTNYDSAKGLELSKKDELKQLLSTINPFYYYYIVKTDQLPKKMRDDVYNMMRNIHAINDPLELVRLFLDYYNTLNPYQRGDVDSSLDLSNYNSRDFVSKYLRYYFLIKTISPAVTSIARYKMEWYGIWKAHLFRWAYLMVQYRAVVIC